MLNLLHRFFRGRTTNARIARSQNKKTICTATLLVLAAAVPLAAQQVPLTITAVTPASGPTTGGTVVTITGTGFTDLCPTTCGPHAVLFGGIPATDVRIVGETTNATTITAVTPPHSAGTVDVVRLQTFGTEARLAGAFTYVDSTPLMLQNGRFKVEVSAVNRRDGRVSRGAPIPYNEKFGFFYFPELTNDPANPEVFVKIVGPIEDGYLLFYGGLTDFEYTLTVTDTASGRARSYAKPAGEFRGDFLR